MVGVVAGMVEMGIVFEVEVEVIGAAVDIGFAREPHGSLQVLQTVGRLGGYRSTNFLLSSVGSSAARLGDESGLGPVEDDVVVEACPDIRQEIRHRPRRLPRERPDL